MKKLVALLLVAMMLCASMAALAESPEGYPEVVEGIDFGGAKIWIYDYWSGSSNDRDADPNEETQAQYDYRDWIMQTYNCEIEQIALSDWGNVANEMVNMFSAQQSDILCTITIPPDFVTGPLTQGIFAPWSNNDLLDLNDAEKWLKPTNDFMNRSGNIYGVAPAPSEPRQILYFNKRVLQNAGIDYETEIYDSVLDGTWTFDAFVDLLKRIQKDENNDGTVDIWGMTGSNVDMYRVAVFNNGGSFFELGEDGAITITAGSDNTLEALAWAKDVWNTYAFQGIPDESGSVQWDYYKEAWKQGFCGFYMYQGYGGFGSGTTEMSGMEDEWGAVPFPVGPKGDTYYHISSDNVTVVLDLYDEATTRNLQYIYKLWSDPTPGYADSDSWATALYNVTDDRAVDEMYASLREGIHAASDPVLNLGSINDVEGQDYLWNLGGATPQEIYDAKLPSWQGLVEDYNAKYAAQ